MTAAERELVEATREKTRDVLERLERACGFARVAVDGNEPELGTEALLEALEDLRPKLPALRRALEAARAGPEALPRAASHRSSRESRRLRESLGRVLCGLDTSVQLGRIAAEYENEHRAAWHVSGALRELREDLRLLDRAART